MNRHQIAVLMMLYGVNLLLAKKFVETKSVTVAMIVQMVKMNQIVQATVENYFVFNF